MNNSKLNLNIEKDDINLNDYLYCWDVFKQRPNKIVLYNAYVSSLFLEFVNKNKQKYDGIVTDIIPTGQDYIINQKTLVNIEDESIFISFTHFDKLIDYSVISDVIIYYKDVDSKRVDTIVSQLEEIIVDYRDENQEDRINNLTIGQNGIELDSLELTQLDYDNINYYYNTETLKQSEKLIKKIKKSDKGLSLIYGDRGTGKTSLVNHIVSNIDKLVIYIPSNLIDSVVNSPDFRNFIKTHRNSVLVIDDCEIYFDNRTMKSDVYANNILQMIDGFLSDMIKVNIIMVFNFDYEEYIDDILTKSNNLHDIISVNYLNVTKANALSKLLNNNLKYKNESKLIDVINKKHSKNKTVFGYK